MDNVKNIEDQSNRYQIIWDLGRRCSYACSLYHLIEIIKHQHLFHTKHYVIRWIIADYANLYDQFRKEDALKKLSFTGGEPTVHPDFFRFLKIL